ncbi:HAD family hydrolase [Arthrobacter rhombi]|uniref:HAD hydrolase-like protein n=1 Tax=Arthrobacter rhombi TaxID=71253 RepID=UPI0031D7C3C1
MIPARAVLLDLDGTLVDPAGGITGGILHALLANGIAHPGEEHLASLVGPPLASGLMTIPGMTEALLPQVIADYREQYAAHGMAASRVYPGIEDLLATLRADGRILAVATSKPEPLARQLLAAKGLDGYFDTIHGSAPDEVSAPTRTSGKPHIVAAALEATGQGPEATIMVGDRLHDIEGARANGLAAVGVSWGFAAAGELEAAGAVAVVHSADELGRLLGAGETATNESPRAGTA